MNHLCSPLRYPGGKNCIFPFVSKLFYENDMIGCSYAEPYAGGAGLALRLLFEEYVGHIFINDYDRSIYAFWKIIVDNSHEFCDWIEQVDVSVESWRIYKEIQQNSHKADLLDLAKSTFFLNRTNVSGVIKGGIIGGVDQRGSYKIDARFNKKDLITRILRIGSFKDRISVSNYDGLDFVGRLKGDEKARNLFVYLDPPYVKKGARLYMNYFSKFDHVQLAKLVNELSFDWMVSYDCNELIMDLYKSYSRVVYKLSQNASNRVGDEVLIFKDGIKFDQALSKLKEPVLLAC